MEAGSPPRNTLPLLQMNKFWVIFALGLVIMVFESTTFINSVLAVEDLGEKGRRVTVTLLGQIQLCRDPSFSSSCRQQTACRLLTLCSCSANPIPLPVLWASHVTLSLVLHFGTVDAAPSLQVLPLVVSCFWLALLVYSTFGPDRRPTDTLLYIAILVSITAFFFHIIAGIIAWLPYQVMGETEGTAAENLEVAKRSFRTPCKSLCEGPSLSRYNTQHSRR